MRLKSWIEQLVRTSCTNVHVQTEVDFGRRIVCEPVRTPVNVYITGGGTKFNLVENCRAMNGRSGNHVQERALCRPCQQEASGMD